jgi:hypothetical protein
VPAFVDITGLKFNRLTVLGRAGHVPSGGVCWRVRCDCGTEKSVMGQALKSGDTKSCGCYHVETATAQQKKLATIVTTHGMSQSPEYKSWRCMIARCCYPSDKRYEEYSSRGITVCQEWLDSFEAFFAHVGAKPSPKHTLDRIDNDLGYFPGNVRWATHTQQNNNKRTTPMVKYRGRTMSLMDAYRESGTTLSYSGVKYRYYGKEMSLEQALRP